MISAAPLPITGDQTLSPQWTWVETLPPRWLMPWTSDIFTS